MEEDDPLLKKLFHALRKMIDIQIQTLEPPETAIVFNQLKNFGMSEESCYEAISREVVDELTLLLNGKPFDMERYKKKLVGVPLKYVKPN